MATRSPVEVGSFHFASGLVPDLSFDDVGGQADRGALPLSLAMSRWTPDR